MSVVPTPIQTRSEIREGMYIYAVVVYLRQDMKDPKCIVEAMKVTRDPYPYYIGGGPDPHWRIDAELIPISSLLDRYVLDANTEEWFNSKIESWMNSDGGVFLADRGIDVKPYNPHRLFVTFNEAVSYCELKVGMTKLPNCNGPPEETVLDPMKRYDSAMKVVDYI